MKILLYLFLTLIIACSDTNQNKSNDTAPFSEEIHLDDDFYFEKGIYQVVDNGSHTAVWNDMWLKEYSTQLIKQQWGANLIKFEGMQLPGGVTLNGRQLFDDATQELSTIEEQMLSTYETPPLDFVG